MKAIKVNNSYVLWVDDDRFFLERSSERLKWQGIKCRLVSSVDEAAEIMKNDYENIAGIIIDVMMDPGRLFAERENENGFRTGFLLYDYIRNKYGKGVSIIFLTNREIKDLKYKDAKIYSKFNYRSNKLVKLIEKEFFSAKQGA